MFGEPADLITHRGYVPGELVTGDESAGGEHVRAGPVLVSVSPADADGGDLEEQLTWARCGCWQLGDPDVAGAVVDGCPQAGPPTVTSAGRRT